MRLDYSNPLCEWSHSLLLRLGFRYEKQKRYLEKLVWVSINGSFNKNMFEMNYNSQSQLIVQDVSIYHLPLHNSLLHLASTILVWRVEFQSVIYHYKKILEGTIRTPSVRFNIFYIKSKKDAYDRNIFDKGW